MKRRLFVYVFEYFNYMFILYYIASLITDNRNIGLRTLLLRVNSTQGRELEGDEECAARLHPPGGRDSWGGGRALEPVLGGAGGGPEPAGPASRRRGLCPPQPRRSRPPPPGTSGYLRHALQATFYTFGPHVRGYYIPKRTCFAPIRFLLP